MADYYPLIAKAVSSLDKSSVETRRALYDRARNALLGQLRGVEPALSEPDITRERLALEEAIRKVEWDAVRRRGEPAPARREADPQEYAESETGEARQIVPLSAAATARAADGETRRPERWSAGGTSLSDNGLRSFREGIGEAGAPEDGAVRTYPAARDAARLEQSPGHWAGNGAGRAEQDKPVQLPRVVSRDAARPPIPLMDQEDGDDRDLQSFPRIVRPEQQQRMPLPERERPLPGRAARHERHPEASAWNAPRNSNRIVAIAVITLLAGGIAAVAFLFGDDIMSSMRGSPSRTDATADSGTRGNKSNDRVFGAEDAAAPQKVVLYEEDPTNPNGTQYVGHAVWRVERVPPGAGQNPEVVIHGDIEIPDQKFSVRLSLRHNDDKQLPASHTVEIQFKLPPDFSHGSIANVPGIMVKQGETTRGIALSGIAVKVMDNFFLVGLSSGDAEMQRNVQLLKDRSWFDIPVVYTDGKRALIAIEKGPPGERAFAEAFTTWEQQP